LEKEREKMKKSSPYFILMPWDSKDFNMPQAEVFAAGR